MTIGVIYWFVFIHLGKPWDSAPDTLTSNETNTNYMNFRTNGYVICFLLLFCVYFTISALQLRYGYRQLKLRNTFMRSYGAIPNIFAKTFYAIPFLFELKVLMDWTFLEVQYIFICRHHWMHFNGLNWRTSMDWCTLLRINPRDTSRDHWEWRYPQ